LYNKIDLLSSIITKETPRVIGLEIERESAWGLIQLGTTPGHNYRDGMVI
jgi:hypothetical protein